MASFPPIIVVEDVEGLRIIRNDQHDEDCPYGYLGDCWFVKPCWVCGYVACSCRWRDCRDRDAA
jgi:hypothetical protein